MRVKRLYKLLKAIKKWKPKDEVHILMWCPCCGNKAKEVLLEVKHREHEGVTLRNYMEI